MIRITQGIRGIVGSRFGPNAVLSILILLLLFQTFRKGVDYGMSSGDVDPSWRYRIFAYPIVLSQIYYGRPYDYVGYKRLEVPFEPANASLESLAVALRAIPDVASAGLFYILNDDKGIVDLTRLAFLFYGIRVSSLYNMYFTVFGVSCLLFIISHFRSRHNLALLALFVLALGASMPAFVVRRPAISILDLHTFGILSMPAALHILLLATDPKPVRWFHVITITFQALLFAFVCHARFSSISQAVAVMLVYPLVVYVCMRSRPNGSLPSERRSGRRVAVRVWLRHVAPIVILAAVLALLPVYQRYVYNPGYFGRGMLLRHPVYHNLLIGMQWNPHLRDRYGLGVGDLGAARAVDAFLERKNGGRISGREQWAALGLITVTTQRPFDWTEYEEAARDLYLTIWRQETTQSLLTYFYHHPLDIYSVAGSYLFAKPAPSIDVDVHLVTNDIDTRYVYRPFMPMYVVLAIAIGALCWPERKLMLITQLPASLALLAAALLVPIVFYGGGFMILAETFVVGTFAAYAAAAVLMCWLIDRILYAGGRVAFAAGDRQVHGARL